MALNQPRIYLICYDIADPARLQQVHRILKQTGLPVQYSVFVTALPAARMLTLLGEMHGCIEPAEDDIRAYPLAHGTHAEVLGGAPWPDGARLFLRGHELLASAVQQRQTAVSAD